MKITVHVKPGSKKESIEWVPVLFGENLPAGRQETLVVKLRAKPVDGEANKALVEALAEFFDVSKSCVTILHGHTSREKVVEITEK